MVRFRSKSYRIIREGSSDRNKPEAKPPARRVWGQKPGQQEDSQSYYSGGYYTMYQDKTLVCRDSAVNRNSTPKRASRTSPPAAKSAAIPTRPIAPALPVKCTMPCVPSVARRPRFPSSPRTTVPSIAVSASPPPAAGNPRKQAQPKKLRKGLLFNRCQTSLSPKGTGAFSLGRFRSRPGKRRGMHCYAMRPARPA